ncbi:hypothetical protein [Pseudonocardia sp. MH-G8]|uniref:hypothetical protein n=1 Tax=Pseudonocardia sp. MH-G8 TaxID=1854588 RepID=UPI00117AA632|nr:hypothetical protein [Pseudonocardia sp. MH-G8]
MNAVIVVIVAGIVLLALIAIIVGVVDSAQAPRRRMLAAERRARWEATRTYEFEPALLDDPWDDD